MPVELDFAAAARPAAPSEKRPAGRNNPARDDLRGLWAEAQAARFAVLQKYAGLLELPLRSKAEPGAAPDRGLTA